MQATQSTELDPFDFIAHILAAPTVEDNNTKPMYCSPVTISFRQARRRVYFALTPGQVLYCEPYKYNIRLNGLASPYHASLFTFELHVRKSALLSEIVPYALVVEKHIQVRGAPWDSMDYRFYFAVQSRLYSRAPFFIIVKEAGKVVCATCDFCISGRGKKRKEAKSALM